jgi:hypothetical protein
MTEWVVAFVLIMYQGAGDGRREIVTNLSFYSVVDCQWYAKQLARQHGNYKYLDLIDPRDRITTYCVPRAVDPSKTKVY